MHCRFVDMNATMQKTFMKLASTKKPTTTTATTGIDAATSKQLLQRHAGVLGLSAYVSAYPYDIPEFMPDILMTLAAHLHDPQPIRGSLKQV